MANAWPCPSCGAEVGEALLTTSWPSSGLNLSTPSRQRRDCNSCGAPLTRTITAPDPRWQLDRERVTVRTFPPSERSGGTSDEHWHARVFDGGIAAVVVNVIVTGSAICTREGVDESVVAAFVLRKLNEIPRHTDHPEERVEHLVNMDLVLNSDDVPY